MNQFTPPTKENKDNPSPHKLETTKQVRKTKNTVKDSKYKLTLEFTGTADDKQVEEEIITILKGNFLAKYTTDKSNASALQSPTEIKKREV